MSAQLADRPQGRFFPAWRMAGECFAGLLAGLLLALAWNLKHPLMYWLRPLETPLLVFAGLAGAALWRPRASAGRRLIGLTLIVAALLGLYRQAEFRQQRDEVLAADSAMRRLGAHFIVGFRDFAEVRPLAERGLIGGIYLARHNLRGRTLADVTRDIAELQRIRAAAGLPPLIVAADQEGGAVSHLSPWLEAMPALASLNGGPHDLIEARARRYGERQGSGLAALGVNVNFGPVVDLLPAKPPRDNRLTHLAARAIAATPEDVTRVAGAYMDGLASQGVLPTLKHFPGLARVTTDTHLRAAHLAETPAQLASDWQPFQQLAGKTGLIMLGHVTLDSLDPAHAASHSSAVVQLLRHDWNYHGLLITDDLNMGAVYARGIGQVSRDALAAGVDLLLVSYDPDQYYRALHATAQGWKQGEIPEARLAQSRERMAALTDRLEPAKREEILARNGS
jgi:beta-N-acetylhexosaminidase